MVLINFRVWDSENNQNDQTPGTADADKIDQQKAKWPSKESISNQYGDQKLAKVFTKEQHSPTTIMMKSLIS